VIQDAEQMEDGAGLHAQACVVGAGPAGIALALRLAESGISVLVLESGGMEPEADAQALYDGSVADATLHSAPMTYRQRRFGGSSTIWGGRCVPFDPIDFRKRSWIAHSGWPIGPDDLAPHYEAANRLCEAGAFSYDARIAMNGRSRAPLRGLHGTHFTDHTLERFSCPTDFGQRYRERLVRHPSIRVVLHANVTQIVTDSSNNVAGLTIRTLGGRTLEVTANSYVLATGGLETPRLLLAQGQHRGDAGLGNEHDWVGRSYMCHIAGTHGALHPADPEAVYHGYDVSSDGVYCAISLWTQSARLGSWRIGCAGARWPSASFRRSSSGRDAACTASTSMRSRSRTGRVG
jgi:choline dehydrogenase-like flavoprotein